MLPRARRYGIRYLFDKDFRRRMRNREHTLKDREKRGSYIGNARSLKIALFRRDGNKCFWCTLPMKFHEATIDHIVPVSVRKDNSKKNLRLIHDTCRRERDRAIAKGLLKINT